MFYSSDDCPRMICCGVRDHVDGTNDYADEIPWTVDDGYEDQSLLRDWERPALTDCALGCASDEPAPEPTPGSVRVAPSLVGAVNTRAFSQLQFEEELAKRTDTKPGETDLIKDPRWRDFGDAERRRVAPVKQVYLVNFDVSDDGSVRSGESRRPLLANAPEEDFEFTIMTPVSVDTVCAPCMFTRCSSSSPKKRRGPRILVPLGLEDAPTPSRAGLRRFRAPVTVIRTPDSVETDKEAEPVSPSDKIEEGFFYL